MVSMKKPARGGQVFPDAAMYCCLLSTLLHAQLIIGCVDQFPVIDRFKQLILPANQLYHVLS